MFISMEGIDGCGKTLMTEKLCLYLKEKGIDYVRTREPGGCAVSDKCRDILLNSEYLDNRCEVMLFLASRAQHVSEVIRPAIKEGKWVITDRYADSFVAYQSFGRGFDLDRITEFNDFACYSLYPDITFYLDIDVETSLARQTDPDRISVSDNTFYQKIKDGFDYLCDRYTDRFVRIDASLNVEEVFEQIIFHLKDKI